MRWNVLWIAACGLLLLGSLTTAQAKSRGDSDLAVDRSCRSLRSLGRMYLALGKVEEARRSINRALDMARQQDASDEELSLCLSDTAWVEMELGAYRRAETCWLESLRLQQNSLGPEHPHAAYTLRSLAGLYLAIGIYPRAQECMRQALEIMAIYHPPDDPALGPFLADMAGIMAHRENFEEAADLYRRAHQAILATYGSDHLYTARFLCEYADGALKAGRIEQARTLLEQSKAISIRQADHSLTGRRLLQTTEAAVQEAVGRYDRAEEILRDLLESTPDPLTVASPANSRLWISLGRVCYHQGNLHNAAEAMRQALNCLREMPPTSALRGEALNWITRVERESQPHSNRPDHPFTKSIDRTGGIEQPTDYWTVLRRESAVRREGPIILADTPRQQAFFPVINSWTFIFPPGCSIGKWQRLEIPEKL